MPNQTRQNPRATTTTEDRPSREELRRNSQFVGTVNEEVEVDVRLNFIGGPYPGKYPNPRTGEVEDRFQYLFGDEDRNTIIAWGPRSVPGPGGLAVTPQRGERFRVRGVVQKHDTFRDERRTTLKNIRILAGL